MTLEFIFPDQPENLLKDKGYTCTGCGRLVKRYSRYLNSNMALALIFLYHNKHKGFVHLENGMVEHGFKRSGDASYLRHYRLIERKPDGREDGSSRNGFYKITGAGIMFAEGKTEVQQKFIVYRDTLQAFDGPMIRIMDALDKKFNYSELMYENTWDSFHK